MPGVMAPQQSIPTAATILGTIGTAVGVYRIYKNYRRRSTDGVPGLMLFLWAVCMVPFGAYAIIQNFTLAIQIQPQLFCFLCLICWGQTLFYHNKYRPWQAGLVAAATGSSFAGLELILILTLRGPYSRGLTWPVVALGVIAAVLLALGLVFPYIDMWKHNGRVVGLSFRFLAIDFAGAFFSLMALAAQRTFDVLGGISYISVMLLEIGIVFFHLLWLWRTRHVRRAAKDCGKGYDEYVSSMEAGPHTTKRDFVSVDSVPQWPKTARVAAILSAVRNLSVAKEKRDIEVAQIRNVDNGQILPDPVRGTATMAGMNTAPPSEFGSITSDRRVFPEDDSANLPRNEATETPVAAQTPRESDKPQTSTKAALGEKSVA